MIRLIRTVIAKRRLERLVRQNRNSFETRQFIKKRQAALKGLGR